MAIDYSQLTEEQLNVINDYLKNDMRKLKKICYQVWGKRGLPSCYHDDLYDDAMNVLVESVISYDENNSKFSTFLISNIKRSYKDWYRDTHLRAKRSNLLLDKNGKIVRDKEGKPIIIPNVSFDAPVKDEENNTTLKDMIASNINIEKEILGENSEVYMNEKIEKYLKSLSNIQRKIIEMKMQDIGVKYIKEELGITDSQYSSYMQDAIQYEHIRLLHI